MLNIQVIILVSLLKKVMSLRFLWFFYFSLFTSVCNLKAIVLLLRKHSSICTFLRFLSAHCFLFITFASSYLYIFKHYN